MFTSSTNLKKKYIYRNILLLIFPILCIILATGSAILGQTTYYVSASGSDSNNGTSSGTPFQSLAKVNSLALRAGDQVLFRRGDTFRGTLLVRRSGSATQPIVFDAYGSGSKPVISGSVPVTNWTSAGNNVWQAPCSSCGSAVTGLYRDGAPLPLGRYPNADAPNKGNLTIRAHTEKYQIFSQENLPYNINWKGAEVVMRPTAWIIDRAVVDAQYGDALNLFNYSNYTPRDNSEYFFQNHPATLDRPGEWCYDAAGKKISIYYEGDFLSSGLYTVTTLGRGIDIATSAYVTIRNLQVAETLNTSVYGQNVSNLTLSNLDVLNAGEDGVIILGSGNNILLENSKIHTINNNGVWIDPYQNVTLRGNSIRRIAILPGRGKSGDGQYNGITSKASQNVLIENNTLDSVGYNGITFEKNTTIQRNVIANYCFIKIDGGGVYAHNGNKSPMSNIYVLNNIFYTKPPGNTPWVDYSIGIFMDDCVENVTIKGNTIFGNTQWGVFLHAASRITFTDNTLFDNNTCQLVLYHNAGYCPIRGDIIKRNIIISKSSSQMVAQFESDADDLLQYGAIDSNYYARPFNEAATIRGIVNWGQGGNFSLPDWQNFSKGQDLHSKSSPITYNQYLAESAGGANRISSTFDTGLDGWEVVYSRYGNASIVRDNISKLDGGSLKLSFPTPSGQADSYAQLVKRVGPIRKGKTYVLRFDAVSTGMINIMAYIRQYGPPFREFDGRYTLSIGPERKSYEVVFTASDDDQDAIIMLQTNQEEPAFWIDNVRVQEDVPVRNNPDDFIKLYYNPTLKDSTVMLPAGAFRDVKNQAYAKSLVLKPFTSVVLLKDTLPFPPADLSLSLFSDKRVLQINEPTTVRLTVRNEGATSAELAKWTYRLPANMEFTAVNGQPYTDNVLNGTVLPLAPYRDTTYAVSIRATSPGLFRMSAQLTTATSHDPDSNPNTGTADGEDDASTTELRVGEATALYESPNPNQRVLPAVVSSQPVPSATQADLSLHMAVSKRVPALGELISYTLSVTNAGGMDARGVTVQNILPDGFDLAESANWSINGRTITNTIDTIAANSTATISFWVRVTLPGFWVNKAQIMSCSVGDPDSTPGNGFTNGEDDQTQSDVRVW